MHAASMITSRLLEVNSSAPAAADPAAAAAAAEGPTPSMLVRPRIAAAEGFLARPSSPLRGVRIRRESA